MENISSHEQSPNAHTNEIIPVKKPLDIQTNDEHQLVVDGHTYPDFGYVDKKSIKKIDGDLYKFVSEPRGESSGTVFFDPMHPDRKFPRITENKDKQTTVGGHVWSSLNGTHHYSWGYSAVIDPQTESVVFRTDDSKKNQIIVNDLAWKNKFDSISKFGSINDRTYAIVHPQNAKNSWSSTLYINDREWSWPLPGGVEMKEDESVEDVVLNTRGDVAVMIASRRIDKKNRREHIFVGDEKGEKSSWEHTFDPVSYDKRHLFAIDESTGSVAVVGLVEGRLTLIIDDIVCKFTKHPQKIELLRIENGEVIVQYILTNGDLFAEKIKLNPNAPEIQLRKQQENLKKNASDDLNVLLNEHNIKPEKVIEALMSVEDIKQKLQAEKLISQKYYELQNKLNIVLQELNIKKESLDRKNEEIQELTNTNLALRQVLADIAEIVAENEPKGGVFKSSKIHPDIHNRLAKLTNPHKDYKNNALGKDSSGKSQTPHKAQKNHDFDFL